MYDKTYTPQPATKPATFPADLAPPLTPPQPASEQDKAAASTLGLAGGAASGVATGVAIGAVTAGPLGAAVGGVIGAVAGAAGGKALVEAIGPAADDDAYWADAYVREPYYRAGRDYSWYRPAYEHGWSGAARYDGSYDEVETRLADDWLRTPGRTMNWDEARPAVRSAWERAASRRAAEANSPSVATAAVDYGDAVKVLDELLVMSRDGEEGFQHAANNVDTPYLKDILTRLARDCATAVIQLQAEIHRLGGEPSLSGSVAGALQRGWTSVKTLFSSNDDETVLNDCVRAEELAYVTFSEALAKPLPAQSYALVQRHTEGVARNLQEVRSLKARSRSA